MCEIGMRIPFSKQYWFVTRHLHLYVHDYYIFVLTVTLLLLTMCLQFVNANTSSNTTFTAIKMCHQISTGPMDLCLEKGWYKWYRNRRYREDTETGDTYGSFANTSKEIVKENNQEIKDR